jgi:hypothetical protein
LGTDVKVEAYISLGSFCELLNNYVLLKDINNGPISQVTAYETDVNGTIITERKEVVSNDNAIPKNFLSSPINPNLPENQPNPSARIPGTTADIPSSLKCIASPFAISTNLGVCLVRNDNWAALEIKDVKSAEEQEAEETTSPPVQVIADDVKLAIKSRVFGIRNPNAGGGNSQFEGNVYKRIQNKIIPGPPVFTGTGVSSIIPKRVYVYSGENGLKADIEALAQEFLNAISEVDVKLVNENGTSKQVPTLIFEGGSSFVPSNFNDNIRKINLLDYFYNTGEYQSYTLEKKLEQVYRDIFGSANDPTKGLLFSDNIQSWSRDQIIALLKTAFVNID